jgi:hypothetical protein
VNDKAMKTSKKIAASTSIKASSNPSRVFKPLTVSTRVDQDSSVNEEETYDGDDM